MEHIETLREPCRGERYRAPYLCPYFAPAEMKAAPHARSDSSCVLAITSQRELVKRPGRIAATGEGFHRPTS